MIIQPARVVIIDDNETHLNALSSALTRLGSASLPFRYEDEHPPLGHLGGARVIFCDLHLSSDALTTDARQHCANIAGMLGQALAEDHGPYLLVIWSQYPDQIAPLNDYLESLKPNQRPIIVQTLDKNEFIDIGTGEPRSDRGLIDAVMEVLQNFPALFTMLQWEHLVAGAAAKTTSRLWSLSAAIEGEQTDSILKKTLGMLIRGSAGTAHGGAQPGNSLVEALEPLLSDRITSADIGDDAIWKNGIDLSSAGRGVSKSSLYASLHIESPTQHSATSRGVLSSVSPHIEDEAFEERLGHTKQQLLLDLGYADQNIKTIEKDVDWCLLQVNAACDEAQQNAGLIPFCLAALVPGDSRGDGVVKRSKDSIRCTKPFDMIVNNETKTKVLCLHGRFILGLTKSEANKLAPILRVRNSLVDKLVFEVRTNSARLGVVEPY